jgi:excinuclease UvrABC nuclease subunit
MGNKKAKNKFNYITDDVIQKVSEINDFITAFDFKERKSITPLVSGVYLLFQRDTIVYIGKATDIMNRIRTHRTERVKIFDSFSFIEISKDEMGVWERVLINKFNPVYNNDSVTVSLRIANKI